MSLQFLLHLAYLIPKFNHQILAHSRGQKIFQICQRTYFHLTLRIPSFGTHMR